MTKIEFSAPQNLEICSKNTPDSSGFPEEKPLFPTMLLGDFYDKSCTAADIKVEPLQCHHLASLVLLLCSQSCRMSFFYTEQIFLFKFYPKKSAQIAKNLVPGLNKVDIKGYFLGQILKLISYEFVIKTRVHASCYNLAKKNT